MVGAALEKKFRGSKFREQLSGVARAPPANDDAGRLPASISSSSRFNKPLSTLHAGGAMALVFTLELSHVKDAVLCNECFESLACSKMSDMNPDGICKDGDCRQHDDCDWSRKDRCFFLRKAPSKGERCESRQTCESDMWWLQERAG
jgi:hypothetical protein